MITSSFFARQFHQRPLQRPPIHSPAPRFRPAATAACPARSGRSANGPCAASPPPASAASTRPRCSCAHLPVPASTVNFPASISLPIASSPFTIARNSAFVSTPIFCSISACAIEPRMSCRHSRQSNEMDSVNRATSAPGPLANRPLRDTGDVFFMLTISPECAPNRVESHVSSRQPCSGVSAERR